jgi:hypothetical protein
MLMPYGGAHVGSLHARQHELLREPVLPKAMKIDARVGQVRLASRVRIPPDLLHDH